MPSSDHLTATAYEASCHAHEHTSWPVVTYDTYVCISLTSHSTVVKAVPTEGGVRFAHADLLNVY